MMRCIQLAKNGLGNTFPNPLVGSVIVFKNKIIGEGWHQKAGGPHAEVNALQSVVNKEELKMATLYVNLEPCSHFGKTPPCADLIIALGIPKVVIGSLDPNPQVAGKGVEKLKNAGCDVVVGVLEDACNELNKRFFTYHRKKRPYIFLKWAQTADGFIAPESKSKQAPVWISNVFSRQLSHKLRTTEASILIGTKTAKEDNPKLTPRDWKGPSPLRIVLDRELSLSDELNIMDGSVTTFVFTEKQKDSGPSTRYIVVDFKKDLAKQVVQVLYENHIQSLIVEGGSRTLQSFIDASCWDEAFVFEGNSIFKKGMKAPKLSISDSVESLLIDDHLHHYKNTSL